jgi:LysM repeat protein
VFSTEGYKSNSPDVDNLYNIIDSGDITMEGVDFPVMGTDNLGNSQMMTPGNNYQFPGDQVFEVPMAQAGKAISAYEEPAWYEKAFDRLASPMTTFGYSARNQDIPDNLPINMEDRNLYDSMIDVVNPFAWIKYGAQAKRDYDKDEYLNAGFNALGAIPIVPAWLAKGSNLKNAYKYNPFAYNNIDSKLPEIIQFNRENNNWIRQVGRSGIDDVQQTGVVREMDEVISPSLFKEKLEALRNQQTGVTFSLDKRYNGPFFKKGETFFDYNKRSRKGYDGKRNTRGRSGSADYIIETKPLVSDDLFQPAYMDAMYMDAGGIKDIGDIGIMKPWGREADNFNYYKKDWWEGYKRTPLEKLQQGGSLPQAQEGFELNQTSDNPFIYGDWAEVSRNVNPATGAITIFDERTGNREVKYSKRGVNWDVGYENWLAAGNKGTLADFKIEAERWKKSKTENESNTQNRERTLPGDQVSITGDFYGSGIGDTIVPTGPGRPSGSNGPGGLGGPSEGFYGDVGVQDNTGITSAGNSTIQPLTPRPITLIDQPEIPFSQQYPGGSMSPEGEVLRDFYVDSESSYEVNSRKNNNSKEKVGSTFLEDTTVTDGDGYTNMNIKSVNNGNKEKYKQVFNIYDTEDNLLAKSVDKTNIFGNEKNRTRVTSKGKEAGYGLKRMGGSSLKAQDGKEMGITNELLAKQAYVESNWDPKVKNSLGYMGLGQIGDGLIADYKQKNNIEGELDPYDPVQNAAVQRWSMNELYNAPWINKEGSSPENRLAKTLAAYNWGRGRVFDMLTEQKEKGIDIYKGSEWLNDLPQETQDYIKMTTTDNYNTEKRPFIQKNYLKALEDASYSSIKSIYFKQQGGETYTIQSGDNLGKIAAQYNMDYKDLASFNNIADPNLIMPNQVLNIPDRETSTTSNTNQDISYRVKPGDSLSKIAKNYRTSVGELQRINNIENPNLIQVDQEILFPETVVRTPVEPTEPSWISTDDIKQRNDSINQLSNIDVVIKGQILNDPNERYIVIDKPNNRLKVYQGDTEVQDIEVILGKNKGDAQTVTKSSLANADQLMRIQEQLGIEVDGLLGPETKKALANSDLSFTPRWTTDYSKGNLTTGAGVYQISNTSPTSGNNYQNAPSFNMTNEAGIEVGTSIHGTPSYRLPSFGNDNLISGEDENNRMSSGCINGKCTDLQALYDLGLPTGTSIYILPEDEGNKFELVDGKPVLRMSQENREAYKGDYTDEKGREQTGQGGNYTTETLTYKPIRAKFDKEKFVDERFTLLDFNDDEEFDNTTQPFISALEENKKEIMLAAKIPGDVYNQIAKMAFGIYGTESEFGDTHSWVGNAARGANKKFGSDGSSPDVIKKYEGFDIPFTDIGKGAQEKDQSVGYTQMRWTQLNDKEKTALESFGITSNEDFLDPTKSAIATATVLGIRYNEQLTADQKKDVWKHLPSKWNKRANYTDRVKNNSVYLNFEQLDVLKAGGEIDDSTLYRNYINGIYNGGKQEKQAEKVYDKLNRRHYWKAKAMDMSPSNYVLTYVVGQR